MDYKVLKQNDTIIARHMYHALKLIKKHSKQW